MRQTFAENRMKRLQVARIKREQVNKYHNKVINNVFGRFDSVKEFKRYIYLLSLLKRGKIKNLKRQVTFELIPSQKINGKVKERACTYVADFVYEQDGQQVVEDTKSAITSRHAAYIIKRKLMLFLYKIEIKEV